MSGAGPYRLGNARLAAFRNPDPTGPKRGTVTADWAHRFPSEQVWKLRRSGGEG